METPIHIIPKLRLIEEILELLLTFIAKRRDSRCEQDVRLVHDAIGDSRFPSFPEVSLVQNNHVEKGQHIEGPDWAGHTATKNEGLERRCCSECVELPFPDWWVSEGIEKLRGSNRIVSSIIPG